jgi:hypothetical protein
MKIHSLLGQTTTSGYDLLPILVYGTDEEQGSSTTRPMPLRQLPHDGRLEYIFADLDREQRERGDGYNCSCLPQEADGEDE